MRLKQIRVLAADFQTSIDFYRNLLGFQVDSIYEELEYALLATGETRIEIWTRSEMSKAVGESIVPSTPPTHSSFVFNLEVDDVDAAYHSLADKGVKFMAEPRDFPAWHARIAHFSDPDGNIIEIYNSLT